jgi:hypothetical protein
MSLLHALWQGGWLRAVDHALALSLRRAREETPDWVQATAALASRALAHGHGRLPLARVAELFAEIDGEREPPQLPSLAEWLPLLRASPWVHAGAGTPPPDRVLVLDADDAIALRRYSDYEARLAQALRARVQGSPDALRLVTGGPGTGQDHARGRPAGRIPRGLAGSRAPAAHRAGSADRQGRLAPVRIDPRVAAAARCSRRAGRRGRRARAERGQHRCTACSAGSATASATGARTRCRMRWWWSTRPR